MTHYLVNFLLPALITAGFLYGIRLMQTPHTALRGNRIGALCMLVAVLLVLWQYGLFGRPMVWAALITGSLIGLRMAQRVKTIQMPQMVALFNGLGGAASAVVILACLNLLVTETWWFGWLVSALALAVGSITFSGSLVASLKLEGWITSKPMFFRGQTFLVRWMLYSTGALAVLAVIDKSPVALYAVVACSLLYGVLLAMRVGGADMPVIISFLNSLSGVAASISGIALGNLLAAGVGALVGVAGMILTQIMCRAMNRDLLSVLRGFKDYAGSPETDNTQAAVSGDASSEASARLTADDIPRLLREAHKVLIVPGYGMALSQAQQAVKDLMDALEKGGKEVKVAVHPVAGRMPGHMHVLLAEVGVDYDQLFDMAKINHEFAETDVVVAVGACDVMNPAAASTEGTPISGMPILKVSEAKAVIVCNLNEKPGYSGVENTLYREGHVIPLWGDASETVPEITAALTQQG
ncbi:MAG TPA: NAD(P)(+) transhydrogenase (Re/Si-specific) subunit beta [Candidatus Hydrogenedentes bacterium]|nr:NAD(P)(+) transhydrogenase (Re/Si-specific) subunit beta [Candidatus Hydrogenedentota bacterium]